MSNQTQFEEVLQLSNLAASLRRTFPKFKREIDRLIYDVGKSLPKCGHGICDCQTLSFEQFHIEMNIRCGTPEKSYEFN